MQKLTTADRDRVEDKLQTIQACAGTLETIAAAAYYQDSEEITPENLYRSLHMLADVLKASNAEIYEIISKQ